MSEEKLELEVSPEGIIRTVYSDGLRSMADEMSAQVVDVQRASHVEWDNDRKGWTVQSAWDPNLYICDLYGELVVARYGNTMVFTTREEALAAEKDLFWDLLPPRKRLDLRAKMGDKP